MTISWTEEDIEKYGHEATVLHGQGVRFCTMVARYRQVFPNIDEAELRRLICLYQAKASFGDRRIAE